MCAIRADASPPIRPAPRGVPKPLVKGQPKAPPGRMSTPSGSTGGDVKRQETRPDPGSTPFRVIRVEEVIECRGGDDAGKGEHGTGAATRMEPRRPAAVRLQTSMSRASAVRAINAPRMSKRSMEVLSSSVSITLASHPAAAGVYRNATSVVV